MANRHGDPRDTAGKRHEDGLAAVAGEAGGTPQRRPNARYVRPVIDQGPAETHVPDLLGRAVRLGEGGHPGDTVDHSLDRGLDGDCSDCGLPTKDRFGKWIHDYGHYPDVAQLVVGRIPGRPALHLAVHGS